MALRRCTRSVDGTIPIPALLYDDEELLASQEDVGVYDGYVYFQMLYLCLRFSRVPLLHPSHPHIALVIFSFITSISNLARRNPRTIRPAPFTFRHIVYST